MPHPFENSRQTCCLSGPFSGHKWKADTLAFLSWDAFGKMKLLRAIILKMFYFSEANQIKKPDGQKDICD